MADEKIIFSMNGVSKILPHNNKVILKDIYLSFFYGAKIGIIGLNGAGKSTVMKIIAGIETPTHGEVVFAPGYTVGYLEQEPKLDNDKTVLEVVQEGVQEVMDLLKEYEEVNQAFLEPMDDDRMNELIIRQGELTEDGEEQALEVGRKLVGPDEFTFSHTDYLRTYKTCFNIATGRGQATFPNDTNDIYSEGWFISNDSLFDEYSKKPSNTHLVVSSWAYNGEFADAFNDFNEKNEEMINMLVGDFATASRVRVVCAHDNFLVPLAVYVTNKQVNLRVFEDNKKWINFIAGIAVVTNDAGVRRSYAVKGLESGVQ